MTGRTGPDEAYREQLRRLARALAAGAADDLGPALAGGSTPAHVRLFTDGNRTKRHEALRAQLEFLAGAFADLDDRLEAYLRERPPVAFDAVLDDAGRFLDWVERSRDLTPEQRDHVACQRARQAVEAAARRDRAAHLHFQELWEATSRRLAAPDTDAGLRVHLNPIRAWSRFATGALLDADATPPADVLFFAVGTEIGTAVLEPTGRELVGELASGGSRTLDEWAVLSRHADREGLVELCRDLAEMGLVAFGRPGNPDEP